MPSSPHDENTSNSPVKRAHVEMYIDLAPGEQVTFTVRRRSDEQIEIFKGIPQKSNPLDDLFNQVAHLSQTVYRFISQPLPTSLPVLFAIALTLYLLACLSGLQQFPLAFTAREAISSVQATDLLQRLAHGNPGWPLPVFFRDPLNYTLGTSVYFQAIIYLLFGQTLWLVRGCSILFTMIAAYWMTAFLREGFKLPFAWALPLFFAISPGWLLLARSGETAALLVSLSAGCLLFTLRYLQGQSRAIYTAVILAALAFYTAPAGRIIFPIATLVFSLLAWPVHRKHPAEALRALGLTLILTLPFMVFLISHSDASFFSALAPDSVWTQALPFTEQISQTFALYLSVLNPLFWFMPGASASLSYFIPGHAYLSVVALPFALLGLTHFLRQPRQPAAQLIILALFCAPFGAAAGQASLPNALPQAIPLVMLATVGLSTLLEALSRRFQRSSRAILYSTLLIFSALSFATLGDILTRAPISIRSENLPDLQYGAPQVFSAVRDIKIHHPQTIVVLSGAWASDVDTLRRFFIPEYSHVNITSLDKYTLQRDPDLSRTLFVLTAREFANLQSDPHFSPPSVEQIVPYPDGSPAFYFTRLEYSPQFDSLLQAQQAARQAPIQEEIRVGQRNLTVTHSPFDMGALINLFDADPDSLARTGSANPLTLDLPLEPAQTIRALTVLTSTDPATLTLRLQDTQGGLHTASASAERSSQNKTLRVEFEQPIQAVHLRLELRIDTQTVPAHVHLWDITFDPPMP